MSSKKKPLLIDHPWIQVLLREGVREGDWVLVDIHVDPDGATHTTIVDGKAGANYVVPNGLVFVWIKKVWTDRDDESDERIVDFAIARRTFKGVYVPETVIAFMSPEMG